ncbi:PBECR2 nuclease fold domain-containing protein, partial [Campylobacter upsaliensis]
MQFNFNFEAFEQSGKEKNEAINYLKSLNSSIDFDKLEQENKGDESAIYEALKGGNFSFSKPSIEQTRQKLLKNKENEALKAEFNAGLSWLGEEKKQNFNFYDFKKAKEKANSKQGLIQADLKEKEKQMQKKEALFETRLKERGIIAKSFDDMLDQSGAYLGADLLEKGLNKLGFKDENYIFESEKEDIKSRALKSVREKLERGDLEFNEREKHALRSKYDELDYKKALEKEKERLRLSQKSGNFSEAEREFIENDLGFFNTLFNDDKENIKEFKEKVKSEGVISSEIIKAANTLKAFDEGNLFKNMLFADEKEKKEFQQNFLNDAYKIAELSGFDDVGLDKKGELYFIKDEQKYLVNTGFFDNFAQLLNDTKFEFAGGVLGGLKGFNSGKSAKGKVAKSILGAAAGSFGGAFLDAKIADMYLNRESDFKKNLDFAIQAGLLSMAGDGVILSVKPLAKGLYKGVKKGGEILGEYSILGTLKTLPQQNIQAAEKIIDEVFSPKMKEELKAAQEEFGGSVRGEDSKNAFFANLQKKFTQKYGENDSKTKSVAKIAEIFNTNSLKTRQQAMLDLVRSDTHGSTLAYLLEIAKDDVKIQSNLKNMLNLASSNVEKNLKNLNINAREIKHILDEFEAGNKAAFKEVESQISKLYDENYRVVLSKGEYENIKEEFRQNGVNLEEMTPFLRDLEANVFNENGVTFTQLNNFRKNLNFYIFNKDKTPNFINTLKKIGENILKNEIDKGIDNIFSQNKAAYESIKELYSTSLKDYATLKSLNESIKNLKLQDSAKSADEVLNSLIKYAKGQGEKGVNNLQKIKDYLGEENNAFLEMQILNKLFKESVVENDRAGVRVFDSESFLSRVRELVGENELYERKIGKEFLEELSPSAMPKQISIDEFLNTLENFKNKENFLKHIEKDPKRKDYLNLIEPTLKEPDIAFKKLENGVEKEKFIKKFSDGKDFFYLLATKDNKETILTAFKTDKINTILKEFNADIIPTFIRQGSKGKAAGTTNEGIITQPLFKSKEAREFLELVEGFHKLYKNDASIAKNLVQGTSEKLSTSIATSAEGAIKQKVVKGAFDPIFRLLPDKILFGLFAKQIQGGALRYHLKKALSRSLNYDDFKIKLEKELKRTNFNSNTSRLIDEFMQNLDTFNAEKEAKLAKIREEQARIKEEERKRAEEIYKRQEEIYQTQEANNLKDILEAEEKPLKDEFGVNFEGFKGKEAIEKLLEEQRGQVRGAFYKEGLGEIDLVWGEITDLEKHKGYGLAHILDKRKSEFVEQGASQSEAAQKAAEFAKNEISNIMQNGKIINKANEATRIETQDYRLILKQNWKGEPTKNKWLVTAYMKKEKGESISSSPFTKEDNLSLNSNESIAQNALSADEAISILQSAQAKQVPKELDIEGFLKELESVENKENFISHLSKKEDAKSRLAYLNLVKPTLEEADLILKTKNKNDEPTKEFIKAFQDENKRFFYIVITEQDNEKKLLTAFKTNKLRELKNRIEKARDFGEISFAHRFIKKSPTAENILKQKSLNLTEKLYLKDNDTPLNVEYKIVNKDDIKPTFTLSKTQFRSQKQEDLIKKIKENFNPDLLVNIRGDLKKGNPIITKQGEVISGNHRAAALKELEGENLSKYQNAVKEAFGVELKENEMLVRVADTSEAEIRRFSAASNEGLENNLGEQGVSLFAKYQDKIKALKEAKKPFVADDVYNLKYLVNKALGESSITKENDTSKALFASLARGRNNTILKALNELEKENLEQVSKVANMFFDNAGAFYNLTHDLDLPKMQNLQNYFSDVLVSAAKADFTRAEDFARLNEDIRAFLDSGDKNAMFKLSPNLVSDLLAKAMGAGFARFARLENPSASLYEFLNGLKAELIEKGMPDLFSGGKGIKLNERDEFDFAKELILKGQDSEEKFRLYQNLEELKAWKSKSSLNQPTKESLDKDLNKSYTLELENLEPVSLNANALSKETEALTQSVESGHKQSTTIAKTDEQSIAQNAKNDEVLEAEVIEEVGLNEPMKFLEFQQRKLLTYIKENTPLRLLEHKKELKTRDILNFLEQSALNGKQKVFLMRNLERDLGKIELKIKENESVKAKIKNTYEISQSEAKELGEHFNFKGKKPLLRELRENEIKHALKSHGNKESEEARGNIAITLQDIEANYPKITQEFDEKFFTQKGVIYVKQVNGHHIVIEEALSGQDKLIFKTMWKTKGNYNKEVLLKNAKTSPYPQNADEAVRLETISKQELEQSNPQQSHLSTDESIAQNSHYLELVKEYGEENAKSIIKQKILSENIAQVLENEEEKFIYKKGDREFEFKIKDAMGQFEMQYDELNLKSDLNKSFLKALNKLKIGYEVLENEPVRIRYFKQEAKERKPKETKPSANKTLGQIQKDMSARLKELKAQAKENYERYKNEDKALQKELTNTKDLFQAFEKEFNETEGTILISRAKRRKNDAEGKVETSVFLGNELALRNALDRWERYSGYSEENALEVKERLELLRSYVKRLEKHREDIKAKREQLEQDYQQNEAARSKEMGVIGNYNVLSNLKGVSENELYEPFLEKVGGYLSKADFYERHLPFAREEFQKLFNLTPLKEFGTNYAEFYRDGKGAVEKLLAEKQGQVAGAFYKEGLGEIDLVWGDENFGLRHIIDKHGDEFEDIAAELDEIIAKGVLEKGEHRYFIKHNDYKGMIALDYKGKESNAWILTLYKDKSALNPAYQHQIKHNTNTSSETRANGEFENSNIKNANLQKEKVDKLFHGDAEVISAQGKFNELEALNLTDEDIIPQQKIKFAMEKFHYDEKKAKDLLEWHKNSHALTKDENGLPKVFYHGTYSKFRVFRRVGKASGQGFFFTPSQKATEEYGDITLNTFLNIKNPFRADELKINKEADLQKWADILKLDYDKEKYESFKDLKTKLEKVKEATKKAGFEFHSASGGGVYVIDNKGRNSFINLNELDKENKRVVEAFKGLETEDIYFYYVVRNEFDLVLYALNKNDRYFHTSGRDEVKRVLEKLGYDGVVLNDTIITVFNSNQIKHIDNKGSFTDTKGNVTSKKPKDKEAEFSYFNEKSDNIYHSNPHLGAGLVGGTLNGVEQDENGNLSFDPVKFAMGFLGG